jgi:hypothetical protein
MRSRPGDQARDRNQRPEAPRSPEPRGDRAKSRVATDRDPDDADEDGERVHARVAVAVESVVRQRDCDPDRSADPEHDRPQDAQHSPAYVAYVEVVHR